MSAAVATTDITIAAVEEVPVVVEVGTKRGAWTESYIASKLHAFLDIPIDHSGRKREVDVLSLSHFACRFIEDMSWEQEIQWTGEEKRDAAVLLIENTLLRIAVRTVPEADRRDVSKTWLSQKKLIGRAVDEFVFATNHPNAINRFKWEAFVEEVTVTRCCFLKRRVKRDRKKVCNQQ